MNKHHYLKAQHRHLVLKLQRKRGRDRQRPIIAGKNDFLIWVMFHTGFVSLYSSLSLRPLGKGNSPVPLPTGRSAGRNQGHCLWSDRGHRRWHSKSCCKWTNGLFSVPSVEHRHTEQRAKLLHSLSIQTVHRGTANLAMGTVESDIQFTGLWQGLDHQVINWIMGKLLKCGIKVFVNPNSSGQESGSVRKRILHKDYIANITVSLLKLIYSNGWQSSNFYLSRNSAHVWFIYGAKHLVG